ncbi:DNA translocase FtsK 4TM domain-containing protein [Actinobacillus equuli subsp. equuli]|uniref:DNA translocase FtsK n=1 Tax=Actinobacillus equuli TaxID=718 RepID=UPI00244319E5|nr:DNA translocase FtsK [Actinobacillus equuli]WGE55759.1 DNA translocase FtsK 4TM domain-containing protein [Actinobacillus equuli subsp. equuli]
MIERFKPRLKGKENVINFALILMGLFGFYLLVAWASYSPLDNAWSTASSVTEHRVLNKTGVFGAWTMDLLYAFLGKVAFIVPFTLCGVSVYSLVFRLANEWTWKHFCLRFSSFILLLIGLAGLASVVLSNNAYYLSGGFVGGMFQSLLATTIGQFGALFIAMIFTGIGFYFCSGQSLLLLFAQFYDWIVAKDQPKETAVAADTEVNEAHLQNSEEIQPLVIDENTAEEAQDNAETQQLTDVSVFSRPNITGLKSQSEFTPNETDTGLSDQNMFNVETELELPKINIQGMEITSQPSVAQEFVESNAEIDLPKIRLNPLVEAVVPQSEVISPTDEFKQALEQQDEFEVVENNDEADATVEYQDMNSPMPAFVQEAKPVVRLQPVLEESTQKEELEEDYEALLAKEFEQAEQARLAQMEQRAKAQGLEQTFENIIKSEPEPVVMPSVKVANMQQDAEPVSAPNYPKGYGDTLIHPLLQRNHTTEKPTTPLPTLDLLDESPRQTQQITEQEIVETSHRLESALANYGVKATVEDVLVGPVVTRYEIKPAAGVKAAKVVGLASDLSRELMFKAIRITEVVPGKPYMGIETPNKQRETVWLRDVLNSDAFKHSKATLPMALGKDISGEPIVVDMAKMPHLLVAGQTGGGKSVGVNTMILSLLFKLSPEKVRFIMIDPKVVELSIYNDIPHLLTPVVTDMKKAANALRWAVEEMERRYLLVSHLSVRNIEGYNDKIDQAAAMNFPIPDPTWRPGDSMDQLPPALEKLSYIVLIVDEFADLMMSAGKEVEEYIMRIAQKARAVGIHLILATQRPSTDVITGVIKANIPSRIAFTVASQIDSRTILDAGGAEALLGRGDMLYSGAGSPDIIRIHGAFMSDEDVQRVADNWRARGKPQYLESIVASVEESEGTERIGGAGDLDPLFDEVVEFVIESGVTSISGLQRRFSLGFNRAARIVDQMEAQGILSEQGKNGKREILAR